MQIDLGNMFQQQQQQQICQQHPKCNGCPYYTLQGYNGTICENAVKRLSNTEEK